MLMNGRPPAQHQEHRNISSTVTLSTVVCISHGHCHHREHRSICWGNRPARGFGSTHYIEWDV